MAGLRALAPAKLNMALHITGKRPDGYHLLESLVVFAEYGDKVVLEDAEVFSLHVSGPFAAHAGTIEDNLVYRAVSRLAEVLGVPVRGAFSLEKRLPVGAGLGGGSSDAVAACRLALKCWGHIVPEEVLADILLPLGADMPICVAGKPLIAKGIGEKIQRLPPLPALYAVLCWPGVSLPTADVYRAYRHETRMFPPLDDFTPQTFLEHMERSRNMLQRAAITLAPEVAEALLAMETDVTRPFTRMSGSGACCVGYLETESAANQLAATLRESYPQWWVQVARVMS